MASASTGHAPLATTPRERLILREVVECHADSGRPVGSKCLAGRLNGRLSSASIRAVMGTLAKRGLLAQPHTSSGRVPTDLGYRVYVNQVLPERLKQGASRDGQGVEWTDGSSLTDLMRDAATAVSRKLGLAGLIVGPRLEAAILQRLSLVYLAAGRVLAVAVTRTGAVHERLLHVVQSVTAHDLEGFNNYLNTILPGRSLAELRVFLSDDLATVRGSLERRALELGRRALTTVEGDADVVVDGTARILEVREFQQAPVQTASLMRSLQERELWLTLLDELEGADDCVVRLGGETGVPSLKLCGLVLASYQTPAGRGLVALIGPKRLDYRQAIPVVGGVAAEMSKALTAVG